MRLSSVLVDPYDWCPGSRRIVCNAVPASRPSAPPPPPLPVGPLVQENDATGRRKPARTYQDLLVTQHDEDTFEHYMTTQLVLLDLAEASGEAGSPHTSATPIGDPAMVIGYDASPDGHLLLAQVRLPPQTPILF